jgi:hypothetical protein
MRAGNTYLMNRYAMASMPIGSKMKGATVRGPSTPRSRAESVKGARKTANVETRVKIATASRTFSVVFIAYHYSHLRSSVKLVSPAGMPLGQLVKQGLLLPTT